MKKLLIALSVLLLIASSAMAEVDLSGMSFDELVALKEQLNLAIWNSEEWQEVTVPQGLWIVGEDIPAGHWTIKAADGAYSFVTIGDDIDEPNKEIGYKGRVNFYESVVSESYHSFKQGSDCTVIDYNFVDGLGIHIENGDVVFTPYTGKPSLGFK